MFVKHWDSIINSIAVMMTEMPYKEKCPKPWKGKGGICDRRGDMCTMNNDCQFGQICCHNGCQNDCVYPGTTLFKDEEAATKTE